LKILDYIHLKRRQFRQKSDTLKIGKFRSVANSLAHRAQTKIHIKNTYNFGDSSSSEEKNESGYLKTPKSKEERISQAVFFYKKQKKFQAFASGLEDFNKSRYGVKAKDPSPQKLPKLTHLKNIVRSKLLMKIKEQEQVPKSEKPALENILEISDKEEPHILDTQKKFSRLPTIRVLNENGNRKSQLKKYNTEKSRDVIETNKNSSRNRSIEEIPSSKNTSNDISPYTKPLIKPHIKRRKDRKKTVAPSREERTPVNRRAAKLDLHILPTKDTHFKIKEKVIDMSPKAYLRHLTHLSKLEAEQNKNQSLSFSSNSSSAEGSKIGSGSFFDVVKKAMKKKRMNMFSKKQKSINEKSLMKKKRLILIQKQREEIINNGVQLSKQLKKATTQKSSTRGGSPPSRLSRIANNTQRSRSEMMERIPEKIKDKNKRKKISRIDRLMYRPEIRDVLENEIVRFLLKKNDHFLNEAFFRDINRPHLSGIMDHSRNEYLEAMERFETNKKRLGRSESGSKKQKFNKKSRLTFNEDNISSRLSDLLRKQTKGSASIHVFEELNTFMYL